LKIRDILKRLNKDGWELKRQEGSHRQFKHPEKKGRVTVAGHPILDLQGKTLDSIFAQAGWEKP